jgi:hypothetical protein
MRTGKIGSSLLFLAAGLAWTVSLPRSTEAG